MSDISRKDFIRISSWSILAAMLPLDAISALTLSPTSKNQSLSNDFLTAKELAAQARQKFYLKNYILAESLYLQAINLAPNYIQFYDGLDNVFGSQNKNLESALLFKNALAINTNKIAFYDRAAKSLMRLQNGNKKSSIDYKNSFNTLSLLNDAVILYQQAILIDDTKQYLYIGLEKVMHKIQIAEFEADFRINRVYKNIKVQHKNEYKSAITSKTNEELKLLIARIDAKNRRPLIDIFEIEHRRINILKQKKFFYNILLKRTSLTNQEKIENAEQLFQIDYKDPLSLNKVKKSYYINNRYFDFIEVRRNYANASNNLYGFLGLMDAMELAYKKNQASTATLDEAISVGYNLKNNWTLNFEQEIDVVVKTAKILLLQNRFVEAKQLLEETMVKVKSTSVGMNNKLIHSYAKISFLEAKFQEATQILLIGVKELEGDLDELIILNPKLSLIKNLANNKQKDVFKDNLVLYYLLHSSYIALGKNEEAGALLSRLYENNPQDNFVLTRN
ncbi:MAG TPA: hypothetical protein PLL09_01230 [Flavobacterium sp.]|uniref:hypothetical protein n=1 Tax=unclassified Flavobacterium TaxID=196869 RepID=UPI0025BCB8AC|nr:MULTISPECIES: hypothetical protein [unclassified Flavobacterium]HRE76423.1 hypothetical protein [Flavobacterium sp.]